MSVDLNAVIRCCAWCDNKLSKKQKKYCCRTCQIKGTIRTNTRPEQFRKCVGCDAEYKYHWKLGKNAKYCSRKCKDDHQKLIYRGAGNPIYGTTWSDETRNKHKISSAIFWAKPEVKERYKLAMKKAAERLGYWPGTDKATRDITRQTCIDRYGVPHVWMNPEIRQKCEETSVTLYGMKTWEIAREAIKKFDTNIERITTQVLLEQNIEFIHPYHLSSGSIKREFDFYIPACNTLIEIDGDYHHANPSIYTELDKTQKNTCKNDEIKNAMASGLSIRLLRFWGSEVLQENFPAKLKEALYG
jgi:very-short-patch-repair endonuclease